MKIVEAIKCYFSLFMSTFNHFPVVHPVSSKIQTKEKFFYARFIFFYTVHTQNICISLDL